MVQDDDLGGEVLGFSSGLVLGIGTDVSSLDVLDGNVLNIKTNVVSGNSLIN